MIALFATLALAEDPPAPPAPAEPPAGEVNEGGALVLPRCEDESACTNYETFTSCPAGDPCPISTDESLLVRKVCDAPDHTGWCTKPKVDPATVHPFCAVTPGGGWLVGALAGLTVLVGRRRR